MSTDGLALPDAVRALLLLLPRVIGRAKRTPPPPELAGFALAPRHLSLFHYLLLDGPMPVNELAKRLEVAPATVSLMVGELSRQGILDRREDEADRRRTIVSITPGRRKAVENWCGAAAGAWRVALEPLTPDQRRLFVETLGTFERELNREE
ncbi:MarR family winged helix-turn-helix transcriptional regulator [Actinophytocola gossypii]|uniref:Winged helix-turn-helix transcriptional regulator n=1 Tax=Actinophytocola gossypii TaxID=2812003 RepID=A0ABT2J4U8_9PSEU|nr:MarR family winged helix-turn-helix transcriptional regulator [Actinophytocola gossypii]MCT2582813.1 winged helix-turn-helix transcriptional regulator [Actinophytocola gossypii]